MHCAPVRRLNIRHSPCPDGDLHIAMKPCVTQISTCHLFREYHHDRYRPEADAVETAQRTLDALQNLPNGSTVADYLINNHVAIPNPVITIRNAVVGNPLAWQTAPLNSTLVLDQGDLLDGDLRVKTTPNAKVAAIIKALDNLGHEISVSLPMARADASGNAILKASDENMEALRDVDRTLTGDGSKQVWMRQTDVAGNVSTVSDRFDFTLDTVANAPSVRLVNDTGDTRLPGLGTDKLTRDGTVEVQGLEPGATWQYRLDDGNWQNGSTTTFTLGGSEGTKRVVVRQTDKAGNASAESAPLEFILDRIAPVAPTLNKVAAVLSGGKTYSKDRSFTVSGLEADSLAEYRLGDGAWLRFTGNSFTLPGTLADGEYRVAVRQTDKAGNIGAVSAITTFTLDTVASAPTLQLNNPAGTNPAGEALTAASSFVLSGVAEKGAQVTVRNGSKEVGTATASATDGSWSLTVNSTLEISGLRRVDGGLSAANGVYQLLTLGQVSALPAFHADFSISGNNVIDTSRPVYRMTTAIGENWYLWSALNDDYRISRQSGADEWYREILNSPEQTAFPENTTSLMAMNTNFATVQTELDTNGSSTHQRLLKRSDISLIGTNSPRDLQEFSATQTDPAGNTSVPGAIQKVRVDTTPPAPLDLNATFAGIQTTARKISTLQQFNTGIGLVGNIVAPGNTDIETIQVKFIEQGNQRDRTTLQLMVGGTPLFMKDNLAQQNNQTIGTVRGLSFSYDASGATLTVRKTNALHALAGNEVKGILEAIKIKNTASNLITNSTNETIRAEVILQDFSKQSGILSSVTSLFINRDPVILDMDTSLPGIQRSSKVKYHNVRNAITSIVADIEATSSASEIRMSPFITFSWSVSYFYADNGTGVLTAMSDITPFVGTVGGVSNVRITWNTNLQSQSESFFRIVRDSGEEFSTNEIQAVIKALRFGNTNGNGIFTNAPTLRFDFHLVKDGLRGLDSAANLNADFLPPILDLDATTAGTQLIATRIINLDGQTEGASLFAKPIATPTDNDTKSIQLAFSGTLAVTLDKLVLGSYTLAFDTSAPANLVQTIAGVRNVAISYTRPTGSGTPPQLVLTKTDGSSFTGAQVKAVLEGLQFKTTSDNATARLIDITLTDQAGNTSAPARARVSLDIYDAPTLSVRQVDPQQLIYDVLSMKNIFGTDHSTVLDLLDREKFAIPYTDGSTPSDFLSRIKGISAAWGGSGIASNPNGLTETTRSYLGFNLPPVDNTAFAFSHQGASYTKSVALKFIIKKIDGVDKLVLSNLGSSFVEKQDIYNSSVTAKALGSSTSSYATFIDPGLEDSPHEGKVAVYEQGPTFTGTLGSLGTDGVKTYTGKYLISVNMGGKLLGFTTVDLGSDISRTSGTFEIKTGANLLAPGFYNDLSFTVTNITPNSQSKGQTSTVKDLALGYYWVAQKLEGAKGGPGNDEILIGTTKDGQATVIETGSGRDTVTVGKFSAAGANLEATISDFQLGTDKVKVFLREGEHKMTYQNITNANWRQFAPLAEQSASGSGTKLVIDLDGAGPGTDKYTLYLPTVAFNYETNTKSIFGL